MANRQAQTLSYPFDNPPAYQGILIHSHSLPARMLLQSPCSVSVSGDSTYGGACDFPHVTVLRPEWLVTRPKPCYGLLIAQMLSKVYSITRTPSLPPHSIRAHAPLLQVGVLGMEEHVTFPM